MLRSKLIDDLIAAHSQNSMAATSVKVGYSWTLVNGKYCGIAKTYGIPSQRKAFARDMGKLIGKETAELAEYAQSWDLVEASIGCAAINSMVEPEMDGVEANGDGIIFKKGAGTRVVVVGAFPFIDKLRSIARELYVLELNQSLLDFKRGIVPETAADFVIPDCDLLVITRSAIVNKSMERLLSLARKGKAYTIILGPSTIFSRVMFDYGADMLAGSVVLKPEAVMNKLSQTGGIMLANAIKNGEIMFKVISNNKEYSI